MNILILANRVIENSNVPGGIYSLPLCNERVLQRTIRLVCELATPHALEGPVPAEPVISWRWMSMELKLAVLDDDRGLIRASVLPTFQGYSHSDPGYSSYRGYVGWLGRRRALEVIHLNAPPPGAAPTLLRRALETFHEHPAHSGIRTVLLYGDVIYSRHVLSEILRVDREVTIATTPDHQLVGASWVPVSATGDIADALAAAATGPSTWTSVYADDWTQPLRTMDDTGRILRADLLASMEETEHLRERTGDHFHA